MTAALNLNVSLLATENRLSAADLKKLVAPIPKIFWESSGQDIKLSLIRRPNPANGKYGGPIGGAGLYHALKATTGVQWDEPRIKNIGLLIADTYEKRDDIFGLMFDAAFNPQGTDLASRRAREGCAIFLGAIKANRSVQDQFAETLFTAVHELGHVFNLPHVATPSFMARSARNNVPFKKHQFVFTDSHKAWLGKCSSSKHVHPGFSAFGDFGTLVTANAAESKIAEFGLELRIDMAIREFWQFEPVELDIELRHVGSSKAAYKVADMIDPGYDEFAIWIEEPNGTRRRYASPRRYCKREEQLTITPSSFFSRDVSIFGQSGGYTFTSSGVHKIQVQYDEPNHGRLCSNEIEINVLTDMFGDTLFDAASKLLTTERIAQLMYNRVFPGRVAKDLGRIGAFCNAFQGHPITGMMSYAIGRALAARGRDDAAPFLRQALSCVSLGNHRTLSAERALDAVKRA